MGKILGALFGFMFLRLPGAILGLIVGHMFDKGYSQDFSQSGGFARFFQSADDLKGQATFFHALFSVMGHIAKADGRVTETEIQVATNLMDQMNLIGDTRTEAQNAFREGKSAGFPLKPVLKDFVDSCHGRRDILQVFLEIVIQAAYADGRLDPKEQALLEDVARHLGFKQNQLLYLLSVYEAELRFRQAYQHRGGQRRSQQQSSRYTEQQSLQDAFRILGVRADDDDRTIKKAYRKLMSEHHPDKLVSKGLPKQALELAKGKAQDIQAAFEMVKKHRKM